ncbi:MAG: hypothetical protein RL417_691 [Pseudomonadota bacterium]|jgi:hypothetical protein
MRLRFFAQHFVFLLGVSTVTAAQIRVAPGVEGTDPRGPAELTVCTQNLENYGSFEDSARRKVGLTIDEYRIKEAAIAERIRKTGCDVVAIQELVGKPEQVAAKALERLLKEVNRRSGRFFDYRAAPSNDPNLRNAFLVAKDRAEIVNTLSYAKIELPKTSLRQKQRFFSRGPFEIQLMVRPRGGGVAKNVTLVTFHFKSQGGKVADPAGLQWETYRMEMAEALRRVVETRHAASFGSGESLLVLLGDRNSNFDMASARILEGTVTLKDFQGKGICRLSKRGVPLCAAGSFSPQRLFSVLTSDPQTRQLTGTYRMKGEYSWLDDITVPAETLRYAWSRFDSEGDYNSGVVHKPPQASDHAMAYVRLNW